MIKKEKHAETPGKQQDSLEQPVFQSCRKLPVFRRQRKQGKNACKNRRHDGNTQTVYGQCSAFLYFGKTEKVQKGGK